MTILDAPMLDFAAARRMMVDSQVRTSDVTDPRLIAALLEVPREHFLPPAQAPLAYLDRDLPVGKDAQGAPRYLIKPMVLAKLMQAAGIRDTDRVLDVGCATGYSAAVLAHLAHTVIALEQDADLARQAGDKLRAIGVANVSVVSGPLNAGWGAGAPYDAIFLNGATEVVPDLLLKQLKDGGRLVCVLGRAPNGRGMLYEVVDSDASGRSIFDASAPVLPGMIRPETFVF
jgi:protein-L-isoaspartate(D-aspartate) O-methyltransferase